MPKRLPAQGKVTPRMLAQFCPGSQWRVSVNADAFRQSIRTNHRIHFSMWCVTHCVHRAEGGEPCTVTYTCWIFFFFFYNKCCCLAMKSSPVCSCSNWLGSQAANWGPQSNRTHAQFCKFSHATWLGCSYKLAILPGQLLARKWNCCFLSSSFFPALSP